MYVPYMYKVVEIILEKLQKFVPEHYFIKQRSFGYNYIYKHT